MIFFTRPSDGRPGTKHHHDRESIEYSMPENLSYEKKIHGRTADALAQEVEEGRGKLR